MTAQTKDKAGSNGINDLVQTLWLHISTRTAKIVRLLLLAIPLIWITTTWHWAGGFNGAGLDVIGVAIAGGILLDTVKSDIR